MAQKVQTPLPSTTSTAARPMGTIRFGLDGAEYEIDLNAKPHPGAERRPRALCGRWPARPPAQQPASHPAAGR